MSFFKVASLVLHPNDEDLSLGPGVAATLRYLLPGYSDPGLAFAVGPIFLRSGYAFAETLELGLTEHSGIDHTNQQGLDRSLAEPIHDAFDRAPRYPLPRLSRAVNERAIIDAVRKIAFLFKAT